MKVACHFLAFPGFALAKPAFAGQLDVLVNGSTRSFSKGGTFPPPETGESMTAHENNCISIDISLNR